MSLVRLYHGTVLHDGATCPKCKTTFKGVRWGRHVNVCGVTPEALFWMRVDKNAAGGCWLWTASVNDWGYGRVKNGPTSERGTHRTSWVLHNGPIPAGLNVLHRCDTPRCVNPDHLFLGTLKDNADDMIRKGRGGCTGERNWTAKLTEEQVRYVRANYRKTGARRGNGSDLARQLGVRPGAIHAIGRGDSWKSVK